MKLICVTTVPQTQLAFCSSFLRDLQEQEGFDIISVSSPGKRLNEISEREGVRTIAVPMERHISIIKDIKSLWKMWLVMRREKPDIVQ